MRSHLCWLTAAVVSWASSAGSSAGTWRQDARPARIVLAPAEDSPEAQKIREKLADPVTLEFVETPLGDVFDFLKDYTGVNIVLERAAVEAEGITGDTPVTIHVQSIQLEMALKVLLRQYNLTAIISNDCLTVTSLADAMSQVMPRAYAVGDLIRTPDDGELLVRVVQRILATRAHSRNTTKDLVQFLSTPTTLVIMGNVEEHGQVTKLIEQLRGRRPDEREAVKQISAKLKDLVTLEFVETPLSDVIDFLKDYTGVNIVLDRPALEEEGINSDTPVSIHVQSITLASALRILLGQFNLTSMIDSDCLVITSASWASNSSVLRVFPVDKMLAAQAKISGDEWVRLVSNMAEAEWQAQASKKLPPSGQRFATGSKVVVRRVQGEWPATVVEFMKGRYKVHFEGADDAADEWINVEQIANCPPTLAEIGQFVAEYLPPIGSLVVLMPRSLEQPVENLIGLIVKSSGAE